MDAWEVSLDQLVTLAHEEQQQGALLVVDPKTTSGASSSHGTYLSF
jgi:hypothetical protein